MKLKYLLIPFITFNLLITLTLCLTSCDNQPAQEIHQTSNPAFQVEVLFEKDGCTMYRFNDGGHKVYWCDCNGSVQYETGGKHSQHIEAETTAHEITKY